MKQETAIFGNSKHKYNKLTKRKIKVVQIMPYYCYFYPYFAILNKNVTVDNGKHNWTGG